MFYVYILYSGLLDKYYVGMSSNPERRLLYHNIGKSGSKYAFTKRAQDWKIVYKRSFDSRENALKYEKTIKKKKSRTFIQKLISDYEDS